MTQKQEPNVYTRCLPDISSVTLGQVAGSFNRLSAPPPLQSGVGGGNFPVAHYFRAFGRGVAGYSVSAVSTAGVFGVFLGVVNAGTCACERLRG